MTQNKIALIFDFDNTLLKGYMQDPIFEHFKFPSAEFWDLKDKRYNKLKEEGKDPQNENVYLDLLCDFAQQGQPFEGLNHALLADLAKNLNFFPGAVDFPKHMGEMIRSNPKFVKYDISVESYIITSGLKVMVENSAIAPNVKRIWGCTFEEREGRLYRPVKQISFADKTSCIVQINKGTGIDVNAPMAEEVRRIPFFAMIYFGDGQTDMPPFAFLTKYDDPRKNGQNFGVCDPENEQAIAELDKLIWSGKLTYFGAADYRPESLTYKFAETATKRAATRLHNNIESKIAAGIGEAPGTLR